MNLSKRRLGVILLAMLFGIQGTACHREGTGMSMPVSVPLASATASSVAEADSTGSTVPASPAASPSPEPTEPSPTASTSETTEPSTTPTAATAAETEAETETEPETETETSSSSKDPLEAVLDPAEMTDTVAGKDFALKVHPRWRREHSVRSGDETTYFFPFRSTRDAYFMLSVHPFQTEMADGADCEALLDATLRALSRDPALSLTSQPQLIGTGCARRARVTFESLDPDPRPVSIPGTRFAVQAELRLTDSSVVIISAVERDRLRPPVLEAWEALTDSFRRLDPEAEPTLPPAPAFGEYDLSAVSTLGPVLFYYDPSWTIVYGTPSTHAVCFSPYDDLSDGMFLLQLQDAPVTDPETALNLYADSLANDPRIDEMVSPGIAEDEGHKVLRYRTVIHVGDDTYEHYNLARVVDGQYIILEGAVRGRVTPAWENLAETLFHKISHRRDD